MRGGGRERMREREREGVAETWYEGYRNDMTQHLPSYIIITKVKFLSC